MGWSVRQKALIASAVAIIAVAAVAVATFWGAARVQDEAQRGDLAHANADIAAATLSRLKDVEAASAAYLITGDDHYIETYFAAREPFAASLEELRAATAPEPAQKERMAKIDEQLTQQFGRDDAMFELAGTGGLDAARALASEDDVQISALIVHSAFEEIAGSEETLRADSDGAVSSAASGAKAIAVAGGALGIVACAVAAFSVDRAARERDTADHRDADRWAA